MTKKKFKQIKNIYDASGFLTARDHHEAFVALTGLSVSEADYAKIRRFSYAVSMVGFCDSLDKQG